ncbi:hypothetical protein H0H81_000264 [Sphagnurus paluster]|uniref:Uncharacterized protein n=1 Tax=Sphagnurus paluster TaxID=117069 RepID=A0A9P7KK25_9AGAR|nr:hypothetical protein H0H81_000264 [Sphagnurus paluster]
MNPNGDKSNNPSGGVQSTQTAGGASPTQSGRSRSRSLSPGDSELEKINSVAGLGETIRGTALGVIGTETSPDHAKYEEIARLGRLETEQGLKMWRGIGDPDPQAGTGTGERSPPGYDANAPGQAASAHTSAGDQDRLARPSDVGEHKGSEGNGQPPGIQVGGKPAAGAYHHRDDGVSGVNPPSDAQNAQNVAPVAARDQK